MIQSYLKTGMVFYDDRDEQHFRSDCCQETFFHYTDADHFPSFEFFTDSALGFPLGVAWRIFDLEDNDLGAWGVNVPDLATYHFIDNGYNIAHDYRDGVIYPAFVNYIDGYYLRLTINTLAGAEYWYSEVFKVCDCEVEGVGDGLDLIENGWMEDWAGIAPPGDYPLGFTLGGNDATNFVQDAGGECQMISNNTSPIRITQVILNVVQWYVAKINITAVAGGGVELYHTGAALITWNTIGEKNFVFQATTDYIGLRQNGVCDITFTDFQVEEFVGFEFCDRMTLNWWSDCDWDSIIYQYGYRNSLVLDTELDTPSEDIVINPNERQGEMFVRDVIIKKRYRFKIRIPEYLWNALIRLPAYGSEMPNFHAWITLPDGSACPMSEVAILGEWDKGNCMNTFTVEFVDDDEYPVVATNCCDDEDVSEV